MADDESDHSWHIRDHLEEAYELLHEHLDAKGIIALCVALGLVIFGYIHLDVFVAAWHICSDYFAKLGVFATVPIVAICILSTLLGIPVDFALVWSGAFFATTYGPLAGSALGIASGCIGVYAGCIAAFLLGRTVLKPRVEKHLQEYAMLRNINAMIEADGWKFALVMRFSPLIPNEPLNYACAMTSMSLTDMAISTLGSLPKTAYEVWLAAQAASSLSGEGSSSGVDWRILAIVNLGILLLMVALAVSAKRKYDHFVQQTKAIPEDHKKYMRRKSTMIGFEVAMRSRKSGTIYIRQPAGPGPHHTTGSQAAQWQPSWSQPLLSA